MKYSNVLSDLYRTSGLNKTIKILNESIYINDYIFQPDDLIIQTGFTFKTHLGKQMELLFNFRNGKIIRQVCPMDWITRSINGIVINAKMKKSIFRHYLPLIIGCIDEQNSDFTIFELIDPEELNKDQNLKDFNVKNIETNEESIYSEFVVLGETENKKQTYPLFKQLGPPLFFNGTTFERYESRRSFDDNDEYESGSSDYHNSSSNKFWDENSQWPGLDPCDYLGG